MKKALALCLATVLLTSLCACGKAEAPASTATGATSSTTVTTAEPTTTEPAGDVVPTGEVNSVTTTTEATIVTDSTAKPTGGTAGTALKTSATTKTKVTKTTTTTKPVSYGVTLLGPDDGTVIDPMASVIREYMAITGDDEAAAFWLGEYTENDVGASFTITWKSRARSVYQVAWADNAQLKNAKTITITGDSLSLTGLTHGSDCYFQVTDLSTKKQSEIRHVHIEAGQVRWINAEGSRNVRDLGGWKTASGKTVRYGMLYRGAGLDGHKDYKLTSLGQQQFRDMLGIKTQIDLRGSDDGDNGAQSTSDFDGAYVKAPLEQYDYIFKSAESQQSLKKIFEVLADEANYPIYFHCNYGSDRTGTLAFLINGLLGVSQDDLTRDYELTGFAIGKRLRSEIVTSSGTAKWKASGVMQAGGGNYIAWGPLHDRMLAEYGTGDGKLSSAIENFLKTQCGVTQTQINEVRRLMLQ